MENRYGNDLMNIIILSNDKGQDHDFCEEHLMKQILTIIKIMHGNNKDHAWE